MPHDRVSTPAFTALLYLTELTRSVVGEAEASPEQPRAFARWTTPERQLLAALSLHGFEDKQLAPVFQRSEWALRREREKSVKASRSEPALTGLPTSTVPLTALDLQLLARVPRPMPDPLGWNHGGTIPEEVLAPLRGGSGGKGVLRVIEVTRDPALPSISPEHDVLDTLAAARGTWIDVAATLAHQGGQVLLPMSDPHHRQQLAVREAIRRTSGKAAPRNRVLPFPDDSGRAQASVVLIDQPERWLRSAIAAIQAPVVVLVLPALPSSTDPASFEGVLTPTRMALPDVLQVSMDTTTVRAAHGRRKQLLDRWVETRTVELMPSKGEKEQQEKALFTGWPGKRTTQVFRQTGVPNTAGTLARLDWPALRWLPRGSRVVASTDELLIRAAVWHGLWSGSEPAFLPEMQERVKGLFRHYNRHDQASIRVRCNVLIESRDPQARLDAQMARVWADLLDARIMGSMKQEPEVNRTAFIVGPLGGLTYIGR